MTNPAGSVNRSKTGRWSDSKLPSGRSDPIPQGQRIVETLDSVAASFPQPPGPADEIIWVTQSLPNAILNTQYAANSSCKVISSCMLCSELRTQCSPSQTIVSPISGSCGAKLSKAKDLTDFPVPPLLISIG